MILLEVRVFTEAIKLKKKRFLMWTLIQYDSCLYNKGEGEHRDK